MISTVYRELQKKSGMDKDFCQPSTSILNTTGKSAAPKASTGVAESRLRRRDEVQDNKLAMSQTVNESKMSMENDSPDCLWKTPVDNIELPPLIPVIPPEKTRFERDDIVWMKIGNVCMPAVVTSADKKRKVAKVKIINTKRREKAYVRKFKDLIDYNDVKRNRRLLDENKVINPYVQIAYDKIFEFECQRAIEGNISAARYLTYDEKDRWYGVTIRSSEENASNSDPNDGTLHSDKMETSQLNNDGNKDDVRELNDANNGDLSDAGDVAEAVPDNGGGEDVERGRSESSGMEIEEPTETPEERLERQTLCRSIINILKTEDCYMHLKEIFRGVTKSRRHEYFSNKKPGIDSKLWAMSGVGPFSSDEYGLEAIKAVDVHLQRMDKRNTIEQYGRVTDYLHHVMVPEAMIFALGCHFSLSRKDAERKFQELSFSPW